MYIREEHKKQLQEEITKLQELGAMVMESSTTSEVSKSWDAQSPQKGVSKILGGVMDFIVPLAGIWSTIFLLFIAITFLFKIDCIYTVTGIKFVRYGSLLLIVCLAGVMLSALPSVRYTTTTCDYFQYKCVVPLEKIPEICKNFVEMRPIVKRDTSQNLNVRVFRGKQAYSESKEPRNGFWLPIPIGAVVAVTLYAPEYFVRFAPWIQPFNMCAHSLTALLVGAIVICLVNICISLIAKIPQKTREQ